MFLSLFFKIIAVIFLILFLLKLFAKDLKSVIYFIPYTFFLLIKSSLYTIQLLFTKTVYIIGLDLIFAFFIDIIIMIIAHPHFDIGIWWVLFKHNAFSSYVLSFFVFTYLIGLYHYLNNKHSIRDDFFKFIKSNIHQNKGEYIYDEDKKSYRYYD